MPKIIIVEDDREISSLITAVCRLNGYKIYIAFSAEKCLAQIAEMYNVVDVVYINGAIAADKGAMLISKVKQIDLTIKILVVANDESARNVILEYGTDDFVIKPFSVESCFYNKLDYNALAIKQKNRLLRHHAKEIDMIVE